MAKTTLPTDFQDDVLNASMNGKRRYNEVTNDDGTFSLEDVTAYDTVGSDFGASTVNEMNRNINESFDSGKIISDMDTLEATSVSGYVPDALLLKEVNNSLGTLSFAQDENGNWGYRIAGADTVYPFSNANFEFFERGFINAGSSKTFSDIDNFILFTVLSTTGNAANRRSRCTIVKNGEILELNDTATAIPDYLTITYENNTLTFKNSNNTYSTEYIIVKY